MEATHSKHGDIVIKFNSQFEAIDAPSVDGKPMKYLPCDGHCHQLIIVPYNVVGVICEHCEREASCES